ncbi:serine/threonine protein kinase [Oceanobacillus kapialis]|uniref:non-specific serine/threonine protein kinase n=1 Tax=Oceanobacillus kapialis TaxID=481353 RepID=A0ABW5Q5L5_9BACI
MSKHNIFIKPGDILRDKYKVLEHIATGGMSEVYRIQEINNTDREWAVKVSNMSSKLSRKLVDETKLLSELDHPTLPQVADFFQNDDYFYLVLEYIEGESLADYLADETNKLELDRILDIGVQLCDVLYYLHTRTPQPIIYRDIKPGNILMKKSGQIKLIDFGISRKYQEKQMKDTVQIGTVGFAAPEQFEKRQTDHRTDLFSLGALLYYLLSDGKYVYVSQQPIKSLNPNILKSLARCIDQLVQLNPEDRIQDVMEAKAQLLKAGEEWSSQQEEKTSSKKWFPFVTGSLLIIATILLFFVL